MKLAISTRCALLSAFLGTALFPATSYGFATAYHNAITQAGFNGSGFSSDALLKIAQANFSSDADEMGVHAAHFDAEFFEEGSERMRVKLRQLVYDLKTGNRDTALVELGKLTHNAQDFYAHTNFVETTPNAPIDIFHLQKAAPNAYCAPGQVAGPLTSGYYPDNTAPPGKCSHHQLNKDHPGSQGEWPYFGIAYTRAVAETQNVLTAVKNAIASDPDLGAQADFYYGLLQASNDANTGSSEDDFVSFDVAAQRADSPMPKNVAGNWAGWSGQRIETVLKWDASTAYFFEGDHFYKFDLKANAVVPGGPTPIASGWNGLSFADGVDAAVRVGDKAYFFRGSQYVRYDVASNQQDAGFPRAIASDWNGVFASNIDEAMFWDGKIYFFSGPSVVSYDLSGTLAQAAPSGARPLVACAHHSPAKALRSPSSLFHRRKRRERHRHHHHHHHHHRHPHGGIGPMPVPIHIVPFPIHVVPVPAPTPTPTPSAAPAAAAIPVTGHYDITKGSVDAGFPKQLRDAFPGAWGTGIDAALVGNNGKIYFFKAHANF